ncbi:MAG: hypothetical protein H7Y88_12620 [Phycisphaerales bacterium]|nr:hypothetical protein [Phycisphaerales bacterium]
MLRRDRAVGSPGIVLLLRWRPRMIVRLTGKLESVEGPPSPRAVVIPGASGSNAGMAIEVLLPSYLAQRLAVDPSAVGSSIRFVTHLYLEGQGQGTSFIPRLIGFASETEREFFELFTTVKGIGNRKALRALAREPGVIAAAVVAKNAKALQELPEIGKRMAETVIAELSGKIDRFAAELPAGEVGARARPARASAESGAGEEAISALVALGETRGDAEKLVARAVEREPGLGAEGARTDQIIEAALRSR